VPSVSATGRFVAFSSRSLRFDTSSTGADRSGVFVRDLRRKLTLPVMTGKQSDYSYTPGRGPPPPVTAASWRSKAKAASSCADRDNDRETLSGRSSTLVYRRVAIVGLPILPLETSTRVGG
jgi:hypothetical protein